MPTIDGVCLSVFRTLVTHVKQSVAPPSLNLPSDNLAFCSSSSELMKVLMLNIEQICRKIR